MASTGCGSGFTGRGLHFFLDWYKITGMFKLLKRLVALVLVLAVAVVIAAIVAAYVIDLNNYKPRIEEAAYRATGLIVNIRGRIGVKFLPVPALSVGGLSVSDARAEIFSADEVNLSVRLWPLLDRKVEVRKVEVKNPVLSIVRNRKGRFNFLPVPLPIKKGPAMTEKKLPVRKVSVDKVVLTGGLITFKDERTGKKVAIEGFQLLLRGISLGPAELKGGGVDVQDLWLRGNIKAEALRIDKYSFTDVRANYAFKDMALSLDAMSYMVFGGRATGTFRADFAKKPPAMRLMQKIKGLDLGRLVKETTGKDTLKGRMDASAALSVQGTKPRKMMRTLSGSLRASGTEMLIQGASIDGALRDIEKSRKLSLLDVGSFFVAGPFGLLLSNTFELAGAATKVGRGKQSMIKKYVMHWDIKRGVATARDAAFSTPLNRIAFRGDLDLAAERFKGLQAAVLDSKGCAKFSQSIDGPFSDPEIETVSLAAGILSPLTSVLKSVVKGIAGNGGCKPFYSGEVPHPSP